MPGCFYSLQSYNTSKIIDPGDMQLTTGFGPVFQTVSIKEDNSSSIDTLHAKGFLNFCVAYRLGIHDRFPFGNGMDIGFQGEIQLYKYHDAAGYSVNTLPVSDLNIRFGLPSKDIQDKTTFSQSILAGWTIGAWIDNGWYLEYGYSFEFARMIPYMAIRGMITPTDPVRYNTDIKDNIIDAKKRHHQKYNLRTSLGTAFKTKCRGIIPSLITPEISFVFPNASVPGKYAVGIHLGLQWSNRSEENKK